jgi:hypothetical protein
MPTFRHGKSTRFYVDQYDMSNQFKSVQMNMQQDTADSTAFLAPVKSYVVGLPDGRLSLAGMFDATAVSGQTGGVDVIFAPMMNSTTPSTISYLPEGAPATALSAGTATRRAYSMSGYLTNYQVQGAVGDLVGVSADFVNAATVGLRSGQIVMDGTMANGQAFTIASSAYANGAGTPANYTADRGTSAPTGSGQTMYVAYHLNVTLGTVTATTITINSSATTSLGTPSAHVVLPQMSASGTYSGFVSLTGQTVLRYLGLTMATSGTTGTVTLTGTITATVF